MRLTRTRKRKRRSDRAVLVVALVLTAAVIWQASFAAFVATTQNPGNAWDTGVVGMTATDGNGVNIAGAGTAVFNILNMRPGTAIADKCITVVYDGDIAAGSAVRLYATTVVNNAAVGTHTLSSFLSLKIDEAATNATDAACTTFVAAATPLFDTTHGQVAVPTAVVTEGSVMDFMTNRTAYPSGITTGWTPAVGSSKSYRFRVAFPGSATFPGAGATNGPTVGNTTDTDLMSMSASVTFTWEVQS